MNNLLKKKENIYLVLSLHKKLKAFVVLLIIMLSVGFGGTSPTYAGESNMDAVNEQAIQILAANGQSIKQVALGSSHSAAITSDGSLWTWGSNRYGQLGNGTKIDCLIPQKVENLLDVTTVSLGYNYSAATTSDGMLYTWGYNSRGQLGDGTRTNRCTPRPVDGLSNVVAVSLSNEFSAAVTERGDLYTWGYNRARRLGVGVTLDTYETPQKVEGLVDVTDVSLGVDNGAAITKDGSLYIWGDNYRGQLGNGSFGTNLWRKKPEKVTSLKNVSAVSFGGDYCAAITDDGNLWTWGINDNGQLGYVASEVHLDSVTLSSVPQRVPGIQNVSAVSLGRNHSAAVTDDGSLWTWGNNSHGMLGHGTTGGSIDSPRRVASLSGIQDVSLGWNHSAAIDSDGKLYIWGSNYSGQLGNGTTTDASKPLLNLISNFTSTPAGPNPSNPGVDETVMVSGQLDHFASGSKKYTVKDRLNLGRDFKLESMLIVPANTVLSAYGELYIEKGGELVVDGVAQLENVTVKSGGKLTVREGGELRADNLTFMGSAILELHDNSFAYARNDVRFNNKSAFNHYGGKFVVAHDLHFYTTSDKSEINAGTIYLGNEFFLDNSDKSFKAAPDHTICFYKKSYTASPINNNVCDFNFGNVYVTSKEVGEKLGLDASEYSGEFARAAIHTSSNDPSDWSFNKVKDGTIGLGESAWGEKVDQIFTQVSKSSAYKFSKSDLMTQEQCDAISKAAALWVANLEMPIHDSLTKTDLGIYNTKLRVDTKKGATDAYLVCSAFTGGGYGQFHVVDLYIQGQCITIGGGASADIGEFAREAGKYVKDEFLSEYLRYCGVAFDGAGLSKTAKVTWNTFFKIFNKFVDKMYASPSSNGTQSANVKLSDYVKVIDCAPRTIDAIKKAVNYSGGARAFAISSSTENEVSMQNRQAAQASVQEIPIAETMPANAVELASVAPLSSEVSTLATPTDSFLIAKLKEVLGTDASGGPDMAKAASIQELDLSNTYVHDLTGLESFTNLRKLNLASSEVEDLSPLKGLSRLEYVDISQNLVNDLSPLSGLTNLKTLICTENTIADLTPVASLKSLEVLEAGANRITSLSSVSGLLALKTLNVSDNAIANTISSVANLSNLQKLTASNCGITSIPSLNTPRLTTLDLGVNELKDLNFLNRCTALTTLDVSNNSLINVGGLSSLGSLSTLNLSGNPTIESLEALSGLRSLKTANLSRCSVIDEDMDYLAKLNSLTELDLSYNPICTATSVLLVPSLKKVDVSHTSLDDFAVDYLKENGLSVTYEKGTATARSLYFTQPELQAKPGVVAYQDVVVYPANADLEGLSWTISDPSVGSIDAKGAVTTKALGSATVTAKLGDLSASYKLTVTENPIDNPPLGDDNPGGNNNPGTSEDYVQIYRLYNRWSHEHLYTGSLNEYNQLGAVGWDQEGKAWKAPNNSSTPVYRLYNPYSSDHYYTTNANEKQGLVSLGWKEDNILCYSDETNKGMAIYQLFNPYETTSTHLYTTDQNEYGRLHSLGWNQEGVCWYGLAESGSSAPSDFDDSGSGNEAATSAGAYLLTKATVKNANTGAEETRSYSYDAKGNLKEMRFVATGAKYYEGITLNVDRSYTYDSAGSLTEVTARGTMGDDNFVANYSPVQVTTSSNDTLYFTSFEDTLRRAYELSLTVPTGSDFCSARAMNGMKYQSNKSFQDIYDANGRLTQKKYDNKTYASCSYELNGTQGTLSATLPENGFSEQWSVQTNSAGCITKMVNTADNTTVTFEYELNKQATPYNRVLNQCEVGDQIFEALALAKNIDLPWFLER